MYLLVYLLCVRIFSFTFAFARNFKFSVIPTYFDRFNRDNLVPSPPFQFYTTVYYVKNKALQLCKVYD